MALILPAYNAIGIGQTVLWATDLTGTITWNVNIGSPMSGGGASFLWTAPGFSGFARLEASNGALTLIRDVRVLNVELSVRPTKVVSGTEDDTTLTHRMMDGARRGRRKTPSKQAWELRFSSRTIDEFEVVQALWETCGKTEPFLMDDPITGDKLAWYFDSAITKRYSGRECSIDYSFRVLEM